MNIEIKNGQLYGIQLLNHDISKDGRGFFTEVFRQDILEKLINPYGKVEIKQLNYSKSVRNVIRGLHYQWEPPMGKLVKCIVGHILDIVVDVRAGSPTYGQYEAFELSDEASQALWVPAGFAHGFFVKSRECHVVYGCSSVYGSGGEAGINMFPYLRAKGVNFEWGQPVTSNKDLEAPHLDKLPVINKFPWSVWENYRRGKQS